MPYDGPGIVAPGDFPIRDPRQRPRMVGRVVNPVGYMERADGATGLGGLDGAAKLPAHGGAQQVEAPNASKVAAPSARGNAGLRKK